MLGETIKAARKAVGLTQKELGDIMGKSITTISQWELGKRDIEVDLIPLLCKTLKLSYDDIFSAAEHDLEQKKNASFVFEEGERDVILLYRNTESVYKDCVLDIMKAHQMKKRSPP